MIVILLEVLTETEEYYEENIRNKRLAQRVSRRKKSKNIDDFVFETSLPSKDTQAERHLNSKAF